MAFPLRKLELRPLGNTGLRLSCVGFGASPLGNVFGAVSENDAVASVREAFRLGINFFDTSPYVLFLLSHFINFLINSSIEIYIFNILYVVRSLFVDPGSKKKD